MFNPEDFDRFLITIIFLAAVCGWAVIEFVLWLMSKIQILII